MRYLVGTVALLALVGCAIPGGSTGGSMSQEEQHRIMREVAEARKSESRARSELGARLTSANQAFVASGGNEAQLVEKAKDVASYNLKDPESAKFRNVTVNKRDGMLVVCGEMNAKNSYGAYTGYAKFAASVNEATQDTDAISIVCSS